MPYQPEKSLERIKKLIMGLNPNENIDEIDLKTIVFLLAEALKDEIQDENKDLYVSVLKPLILQLIKTHKKNEPSIWLILYLMLFLPFLCHQEMDGDIETFINESEKIDLNFAVESMSVAWLAMAVSQPLYKLNEQSIENAELRAEKFFLALLAKKKEEIDLTLTPSDFYIVCPKYSVLSIAIMYYTENKAVIEKSILLLLNSKPFKPEDLETEIAVPGGSRPFPIVSCLFLSIPARPPKYLLALDHLIPANGLDLNCIFEVGPNRGTTPLWELLAAMVVHPNYFHIINKLVAKGKMQTFDLNAYPKHREHPNYQMSGLFFLLCCLEGGGNQIVIRQILSRAKLPLLWLFPENSLGKKWGCEHPAETMHIFETAFSDLFFKTSDAKALFVASSYKAQDGFNSWAAAFLKSYKQAELRIVMEEVGVTPKVIPQMILEIMNKDEKLKELADEGLFSTEINDLITFKVETRKAILKKQQPEYTAIRALGLFREKTGVSDKKEVKELRKKVVKAIEEKQAKQELPENLTYFWRQALVNRLGNKSTLDDKTINSAIDEGVKDEIVRWLKDHNHS